MCALENYCGWDWGFGHNRNEGSFIRERLLGNFNWITRGVGGSHKELARENQQAYKGGVWTVKNSLYFNCFSKTKARERRRESRESHTKTLVCDSCSISPKNTTFNPNWWGGGLCESSFWGILRCVELLQSAVRDVWKGRTQTNTAPKGKMSLCPLWHWWGRDRQTYFFIVMNLKMWKRNTFTKCESSCQSFIALQKPSKCRWNTIRNKILP